MQYVAQTINLPVSQPTALCLSTLPILLPQNSCRVHTLCTTLHHQGPDSIHLQPTHCLPRFHENAYRNKSGKKLHPEFNSLSIACPNLRFQTHGCVLTGTSQARRSIPSSAGCQCAGSALTCWGRRLGTCRGTGKMKEAMTSTAASVLVWLLGVPAPCCTVPRMAARRASALGEPSHHYCCVLCLSGREKERIQEHCPHHHWRHYRHMQKHVYMRYAPKGVRVCCCDQRLLYCFNLWSASHAVLYAPHEWACACCQLDVS